MKIILVSGKARVGKDTFSDYILDKCKEDNIKACKMQISTYIKYYAKTYFGWDGCEESKPRELLQELGTNIIRNKIDPLFHVNRFIEDVKVLSFFFDVAVVSDVRTVEEIEEPKKVLKNHSIYSVNITRPNLVNDLTEKQSKHLTEVALDNYDNYDYKIINNKTKEDLKEKAINVYNEVIK